MIEGLHFGKLVVIADVMLDCYVAGNVERISPEAPVPVVRQSRRSAVPGGAANVAINAAALGCSVTLIGAVGPDDIGMSLRNAISSHSHIDLSMLVEVPGWSTISKTRIISSGQQIVRVDAEYLIDFDDTIRRTLIARTIAALEGASVLVCFDYAKGVLSRDVVSAIIKEARARGIPVIVDPKIRDFTCYAGASLITPNRSEATLASGLTICGDADAEQAAALLSGQFGGDVLITRSEDGMTLWQRNGHVLHQPARKTEVFDVSGAGDTVLATIAAILSTGQDLETAVVIATFVFSLVIFDWFRDALEEKGIRPCIPGQKSRAMPIRYDKRKYKHRNRIEIMFGRLKDWRRVATRYDRCPNVFFSAICLAATVMFWL